MPGVTLYIYPLFSLNRISEIRAKYKGIEIHSLLGRQLRNIYVNEFRSDKHPHKRLTGIGRKQTFIIYIKIYI